MHFAYTEHTDVPLMGCTSTRHHPQSLTRRGSHLPSPGTTIVMGAYWPRYGEWRHV